MKSRLDHYLVENQHSKTRSQARLMVKGEQVKVNGKLVQKPGFLVGENDTVEVENCGHYVGRGALKLKAAVEVFGVEVEGKIIADCGASTGGFTDYLLQNGASKSYCLDVGHDQLDSQLKNDGRVINLENTNLKHPVQLPEKVDLAVADLSFISLRLVLPTIRSFLKEGAEMILLFKPQFEVGKGGVSKNGVVKDEKVRQKALEEFKKWCKEEGLSIKGVIESPVEGKGGES